MAAARGDRGTEEAGGGDSSDETVHRVTLTGRKGISGQVAAPVSPGSRPARRPAPGLDPPPRRGRVPPPFVRPCRSLVRAGLPAGYLRQGPVTANVVPGL
ncbi:hypothetical protein GCM10010358_65290 [Streptomyces minutiscleroticus]|uniref:Uncharacterized protein n=1 Tax=Streptomyces minutiscleroticus TaxID=68238 RepID=A0A918U6X7_9ACTN|nr:hypothetical protein GCM10010358_65290 [Streptomyces minutiscleroticus]